MGPMTKQRSIDEKVNVLLNKNYQIHQGSFLSVSQGDETTFKLNSSQSPSKDKETSRSRLFNLKNVNKGTIKLKNMADMNPSPDTSTILNQFIKSKDDKSTSQDNTTSDKTRGLAKKQIIQHA